MIFLAELLLLRVGALVGAGVIAVAVVLWNWPQPAPMSPEEEEAFERRHGIPVRASGSDAVARWGMGLAVLSIAIAFGTMLLTYFYLRIENPVWPPPGFPLPEWPTALVNSVFVLLAGAMVWGSLRAARSGSQLGTVLGLALSVILGGMGGVRELVEVINLPFGADWHAYGSVFHLLAGFALTVLLAGLVMSTAGTVWALQGEYSPRRHVPLLNMARYWGAAVTVWAITAATLYGFPYLLRP